MMQACNLGHMRRILTVQPCCWYVRPQSLPTSKPCTILVHPVTIPKKCVSNFHKELMWLQDNPSMGKQKNWCRYAAMPYKSFISKKLLGIISRLAGILGADLMEVSHRQFARRKKNTTFGQAAGRWKLHASCGKAGVLIFLYVR